MRKFVFVASSLLLLLAPAAGGGGTAQAADLDWRSDRSLKDEPILVPRYRFSWTGFYIGGHVGYGWGDTATFSGDGGFDGATDGFVIHPSGWLGGIQGGYNWQFDNFLFGVEGDLGMLGASDSESTATAFSEAEYGAYGTLTARIGVAEDRWLFYLKGGLALAEIENRAGALLGGGVVNPFDLTETDETRLGWAFGGGLEYAFRPDWSLKIEYMYMDFGTDTSGNFDGDGFSHDNDLHSIKVGVNYRFQPMLEPLQ